MDVARIDAGQRLAYLGAMRANPLAALTSIRYVHAVFTHVLDITQRLCARLGKKDKTKQLPPGAKKLK